MVPQHPRKPTNITNPPLAIKIMEGSMKPIFPRKALSCPGSISFHIPIPKTAAPASCENEEWKYDQRFYQGRYRRSFKIQILPRTPLWKEKKYIILRVLWCKICRLKSFIHKVNWQVETRNEEARSECMFPCVTLYSRHITLPQALNWFQRMQNFRFIQGNIAKTNLIPAWRAFLTFIFWWNFLIRSLLTHMIQSKIEVCEESINNLLASAVNWRKVTNGRRDRWYWYDIVNSARSFVRLILNWMTDSR